jgi:uncharacterized protein YkwD
MTRTLVRVGSVVALLCLLGTSFATVDAQPAAAANPALEAQLLTLINGDRISSGLPPLVVSAGLTRAAQNWSDFELGIGTIEHDLYPLPFLAPVWLHWGENVGVGPSPAVLNTAFMNSPLHRANILGDFNRIGVGLSLRGDGSQFVDIEFEKIPGT